jgi:hypothetical protein
MDINQQLQPIVTSLLDSLKGSIETELRDQISQEIINRIATTEVNSIIEGLVEQQLKERVAKFDFINASHEQLARIVAQLTDQVQSTIVASANQQINSYISQKLGALDFADLVGSLIGNKLSAMVNVENFPSQSIPQTSINFTGLTLSGDHIQGGIIKQFGSVGIEDRSTRVQMTVMDKAVVFEGPVWLPSLLIKGDAVIDGQLTLGNININSPAFATIITHSAEAVTANLDTALFTKFSDIVFARIQSEGIALDQITQNGKEVVKGSQLGYHIVDTNIQRLGLIRDLQTQGEAYLSSTLYTTAGRVGVNTMDPSAVLSIWDEEVEINFGKRSQDTGIINTPRYQTLVLGANGNNNLTLTPDGSVEVDRITIGTVIMTSATTIPNYSGITGQIVWNQAPAPGSAIGWVCLGGTRWAKFGIIE